MTDAASKCRDLLGEVNVEKVRVQSCLDEPCNDSYRVKVSLCEVPPDPIRDIEATVDS